MYNSGPRKVATIHPVAIRNPGIYEPGTWDETSAGPSGCHWQPGKRFTIAEYPSTSERYTWSHLTGNRGTYKGLKMQTPLPLPKSRQAGYSKREQRNSSVFSLLPGNFADGSSTGPIRIKGPCGNGSSIRRKPSRPLRFCVITCTGVSEMQITWEMPIHVKINAGGIIPAIRPMDITKGTLATNVLYGDFEVVKADYARQPAGRCNPHSEFIGNLSR